MQFLEGCNQYAQLFDRNLYHITVAYLIGAENALIREKTEADQVIFFDMPRRAIRGLKIPAIKTLLALCRSQHFDMVFCHRYKPSYIMLWVAQFCRIRALFFIMHAMGTMRSIPRRLLIAALLKKSMTFIGVSNAVQTDLKNSLWRVPAERIVTYYNIMDYELFEPQMLTREQARQHLNITESDFIFGTIGRLAKEKDQKTLIAAFALIKSRCPTAKLAFIGDGKLEHELRKQTQALHLENEVIFAGFIPNGFRYMKAFDVFILNSVKEAFGRVLLEAMLAFTPIIAARSDGIPEVVGDAGLLIEPKNPEQLADAMLQLYQLPKTELAALGEKGYERMARFFSLQRFHELFWQAHCP